MTKPINKSSLFIPFLMATLLLNGCAATNSSFECPNKGIAMCKRLDQVNQLVNQGAITAHGYNGNGVVAVDRSGNDNRTFNNFSLPYPMQYRSGMPIRYGETVMQAWMAPYVDKNGIYHQQSKIDVVVKKGHWIGSPVSSKNIG